MSDYIKREDAEMALTGAIPDGMTIEEYISRTARNIKAIPSASSITSGYLSVNVQGDYISRQAAIDVLAEHMMYEATMEYATASDNIEDWKDVARSMLSGIPCADVVEVVRCKECKQSSESALTGYIYCPKHYENIKGNEFCSYGERRESNV